MGALMDIYARLDNWKNYYKDKGHYSTCKSLENHFKQPEVTKALIEELKKQNIDINLPVYESKVTAKVSIDLKDAENVEYAVTQLEHKHKCVLVVQYMYPYLTFDRRFNITCKAIGISCKSEVFDKYLKESIHMVENMLTNTTYGANIDINLSKPAHLLETLYA